MDKYKNLIVILVVFGAIHLVFTGAITPVLSKWLMEQGQGNKVYPNQLSYMIAFFQYSDVIIWLPMSIWVYKDSKKIAFVPWIWALLMLIAHYQGLIIYLLIQILRDKEMAELKDSNQKMHLAMHPSGDLP